MNLLKGWDKLIGSTAAHVQHGLDRVIEWGFHRMRDVEPRENVYDPKENKYLRAFKKSGRGLLNFLGNTGETYYKTYEELKKKS